jgi:hypothetical protein
MRFLQIFLVLLSLQGAVLANAGPVKKNPNTAFGLCKAGYTLVRGGSGCTSTNQGCYTTSLGCCHLNKGCQCGKTPNPPGVDHSKDVSVPPLALSQLKANPENENFCTVFLALKKYKLSGALEDIYSDLISECSK